MPSFSRSVGLEQSTRNPVNLFHFLEVTTLYSCNLSQVLDPVAGAACWSQLLDSDTGESQFTGASHRCQLLVPVTGASYYFQLVEPVTGARYWSQILEPDTVARYWSQILVPVTGARYWSHFLELATRGKSIIGTSLLSSYHCLNKVHQV